MSYLWNIGMHSKQVEYLQLSILKDRGILRIVIGWSTAAISALLIHLLLQHSTMSSNCSHFMVIFSIALVMWIFRLVPESIPAMFIILSTFFFNINPQQIIFSGFVSDSFFLTLSLLAIGFVIIKSRLFYRFALHLLYLLPPKHTLLQKTLFGIGALMTPIISVQSARLTLMAPLLDDLMSNSKIKPCSTSADALVSAGFNGCILLSTIFLTGKSSNSVIYAMLAQQNPGQCSWFSWLLAASFPGLLLIGLFFVMQFKFFKVQQSLDINKFRLQREIRSLGTLSVDEWAAIFGVMTFLIGLLFSSWQHISSMWICCSVFLVLLLTGAMEGKELKTGINWTFLFYMGAIIGIMRYIQNIGIDLWLCNHLLWVSNLSHNTILLITSIYLISWLCGLILGTMTAPALLLTVLLPMTQKAGVNSWLIAFIILTATEAWIFPYQSNYYLYFEELINKRKNFRLKPILQLNSLFVGIKLGILLLSIPFWHWLKVL